MKKSEFERARAEYWREVGPPVIQTDHDLRCLTGRDVEAAEAAGVTWDPEGPEVLWETTWTKDATPRRILADGRIEYSPGNDRWIPLDCPTTRELAHRLLAERAEKAKQDILRNGVLDGLVADRDHVTDGSPCWCDPVTEKPAASAERPARPRLARITKASGPLFWYARHVGKVFEVESVETDGLFKGDARVAGQRGKLVCPKDFEYLEFLDLDS